MHAWCFCIHTKKIGRGVKEKSSSEPEFLNFQGEGRWVAKLVARLLATAALWILIKTSLKNIKMRDISIGVVLEDAKSYLGPAPSPPQLIQSQWLPLSFSLTHRAGTCLPLLACNGGGHRSAVYQQCNISLFPHLGLLVCTSAVV
jgi:hypothetical protein